MKQAGTILIVDDDPDILTAGKLLLKREFEHLVTCSEPSEIPLLMARFQFDAILLDMNFGPGESSGFQGYSWLEKILQIQPNAVVIMITAHGGVNVAVEAMKKGATDFVAKPWQNEKLVATVSSAVKLGRSRSETRRLKQTNKELARVSNQNNAHPLLGQSSAMKTVHSLIERTAATDANVLILGENGTGKELVARALHNQSLRANQIFMSVDLGAVSESLFESELFGHKKGAFTGANDERVGRFQAANGGTLFLDEIGNLPLHLQAKLLTALEQRKVTPLGANEAVDIDVRVLAATNVVKSDLTNEDKFRQDLLFRLNTVEIQLPPLRERKEDLLELSQHYLQVFAKKYDKLNKSFSPEAVEAMSQYAWPGNIRALKHCIERAVILSQESAISALDLQLTQVPEQAAAPVPATHASINTKTNESSIVVEELNLEKLEKMAIKQALSKHGYNISHAAKDLGLTRAALYRRMEKHGI